MTGLFDMPALAASQPAPKNPVKGDHVVRSAWFSDDGRYRWALSRIWRPGRTVAVVCGLNPSTADAFKDDPTIYSVSVQLDLMGYGGLLMLNAFAFKATMPQDMLAEPDPVGEHNDRAFKMVLETMSVWGRGAVGPTPKPVFVAAWGRFGAHRGRDLKLMDMLDEYGVQPQCFAVTMSGAPRHPLYLPHGTTLKPYMGRPV